MIRENVQRRAFVTCNQGKTSNRHTIVGSRILGRIEERTKSLRGRYDRDFALTFVRPLRRDQSSRSESLSPCGALPPRRTKNWAHARSSVLKVVFLRVKAREYFEKNSRKSSRWQKFPRWIRSWKRMNCKCSYESCINHENSNISIINSNPITNCVNIVKTRSILWIEIIIIWIVRNITNPFKGADICNINAHFCQRRLRF